MYADCCLLLERRAGDRLAVVAGRKLRGVGSSSVVQFISRDRILCASHSCEV